MFLCSLQHTCKSPILSMFPSRVFILSRLDWCLSAFCFRLIFFVNISHWLCVAKLYLRSAFSAILKVTEMKTQGNLQLI
jgi:hypothetical protein